MYECKKVKTSIIIPSWFVPGQHGKYCENETYWFAQECLKRLLNVTQMEENELIIIDNGSTLEDDDIEPSFLKIHQYWEKADILIRNKKNLGFAPSCNQGFAVAKGDYIVCLNNDVLVWEGWLDAMIEAFSVKVEIPVGVVMPALMRETKSANEAIDWGDNINLGANYESLGVRAEFGSCWMIQRELLDKIKKEDGYIFDENFKLGMGEDRDLWDRVRVHGFETYRTHKTRVFHQGNMTIGKVKDRRDYTYENRKYLAQKRETRLNS